VLHQISSTGYFWNKGSAVTIGKDSRQAPLLRQSANLRYANPLEPLLPKQVLDFFGKEVIEIVWDNELTSGGT
jgi:hypothetical protein